MLYYIKKFIVTLIEAGLIFLLTSYLTGVHFDITASNHFYIGLFFVSLLFLLILKKAAAQLRRFLNQHITIQKVDRMSGEEFEAFLKTQFEYLGCRVKTTKASNDYGADLILKYKGKTIAVQAKRYQSSIGIKAVQEVIGSMAYYGADTALVVTNSHYTKSAKNLADANNIILWDREILIRMMNHENMSSYLHALLRTARHMRGD